MRRRPPTTPLRAATRVAAIATLVGACLYALVCGGLIVLSEAGVMRTVDHQIGVRLGQVEDGRANSVTPRIWRLDPFPEPRGNKAIGAEYVWQIGPGGGIKVQSPNAPALPTSLRHVGALETTRIDGVDFRLAGRRLGDDWVVVGANLAFVGQLRSSLIEAAAAGFLPVMLLVFGASLLIGRGSAAPIEQARRHLLDFTGDASHELRTPLQIVEAELSLALRRPRDAGSYRRSLERISREAGHMRRLVDDLLWLARFDSRTTEELPAPVDLLGAAARAVERFQGMAARRSQELTLDEGPGAALLPRVLAPEAWVDRLLGALLDNACRYVPEGGAIAVSVDLVDGRPTVAVGDSGPGIPDSERERIFDRFHRATTVPGGSGLGLAIADAVVSTTGGRWEAGGRSELGGARFAVSWPAGGEN
jgi:signal transduction histidine kinase